MTLNLFDETPIPYTAPEVMAPGAALLRGFAADGADALLQALAPLLVAAPLRHLVTPGGYTMSVAMSNCGELGWISDRSGYRYERVDPLSGQPWPPMPACFVQVAVRAALAAGFEGFQPASSTVTRPAAACRCTRTRTRAT